MSQAGSSSITKRRKITAGDRYGRLIAVEFADRSSSGHARWRFRCDCGNEKVFLASNVKRGTSRSCGCLNSEVSATRSRELLTKHGLSRSSEYKAWTSMRDRCSNPDATAYPSYGGRGIKVCDWWRESFEDFYADMGPKPSPEHSLDRIDNDGNYDPGNCRWATTAVQSVNKRSTHYLTFRGETATVREWSRRLRINNQTIHERLSRGWSVDRTLSTPCR